MWAISILYVKLCLIGALIVSDPTCEFRCFKRQGNGALA